MKRSGPSADRHPWFVVAAAAFCMAMAGCSNPVVCVDDDASVPTDSGIGCGDTDGSMDAGLGDCDTSQAGAPGTHEVDAPWGSLRYLVALESGVHVAAGQVVRVAGVGDPAGWAEVNGQAVSQAGYPELYAAIGATYGGNATEFNLPDMRGRIPVGAGAGPGLTSRSLGEAFGAEAVALDENHLATHTHSLGVAPDAVDISEAGGGMPHEIAQPSTVVTFAIRVEGSFPPRSGPRSNSDMLGQVDMFLGASIPSTHLPADGRSLLIASHTALYSILGTNFGGDGRTTFRIPDLRGRTPVHVGQGPGLSSWRIGDSLGSELSASSVALMSSHSHDTPSLDPTSAEGGEGTHSRWQPGLGLGHIVALEGQFPSGGVTAPQEGFLSEVLLFAGNFAPGGWASTDGQFLDVAAYDTLFAIVGTLHGGDGRTTFGLPDLRSRALLHVGQGPGLTDRGIGDHGGAEAAAAYAPAHAHAVPPQVSALYCVGP